MADSSFDYNVIVIGAGAAGLLTAARAAERGRRVLLLEKNRKPGVKILMSGGTRCNITHDTDRRGIVEAFGAQGKFLHSALAALGPRELVALIEAEGVATKIEATGKVFPVSNKALDVLNALLRRLERSGATLALEEPVQSVNRVENGFQVTTARRTTTAAKVILTSGGQSYPGCGTTGDGYRWAAALGHTIVPPRPALVPVTADAPWLKPLQGVTIPDVEVEVVEAGGNGDPLARRRGSFLFAHFGLSGPAVMDVSRAIAGHPSPQQLRLVCDFLPGTKELDLDEWLKQESIQSARKQLASVLAERLPRRFADATIQRAGMASDRRAAALSKPDRAALVRLIKRAEVAVAGTLGFKKAEVTAGGVRLDEVDSRTMESKLVPGFFLAGEILDLDGPIGGYNFQAAFSTGWLAGSSV